MSLLDQLSNNKFSHTNVFDLDVKKKKSLMYEDGASKSRDSAYWECKSNFDTLCSMNKKFFAFENLFSETNIDMPTSLLNEDEINNLKRDIQHFLFLVTGYLDNQCALLSVEWLIFKHEAHLHQPEDLLISFFPLHDRPIFVKCARLIDTTKKEFNWLEPIIESGRAVDHNQLSGIFIKNPSVFNMVCNWPARICAICGTDAVYGHKVFNTVFRFSLPVIKKALLLGPDKMERILSPIVNFILGGLQSQSVDFVSLASILIVYMSMNIQLNETFLNDSIKSLLRTDIIKDYLAIRAVLDLKESQEFKFSDKMEKLYQKKFEKLSVEQKEKVLELLNDQIIKTEDSLTMEIDENHNIENKPIKKKKKKEVVFDWMSQNIEEQLIETLTSTVISCQGPKWALAVLTLMKDNPKDVKIAYKHGGLVSHLCWALVSPFAEIRRAVRKLMPRLVVDWPGQSVVSMVKKNDLATDPACLLRGDIGRVLMTEMDAVCVASQLSVAMRASALAMINKHTITWLPSLPNLWPLFLTSIADNDAVALASLAALKQSLTTLTGAQQHSILNAVTDNLSTAPHLAKATETLATLHLSLANIEYLLKDVATVNATSATKTKSLKKFGSGDEQDNDFYSDNVRHKIQTTLGALNRITSLSASEQLQLIQPMFAILRRTFKSTSNKKSTDVNNMVSFITNLMTAMLSILTSAQSSLDDATKQSLSLKIRIEDISKCLYMFNDVNLHNLILSVIKTLVSLELGLEQFNLTYFMNWIGSNVVPRDDNHSLSILNSVLEEILAVSIKIKQKSEDVSTDKVKIISFFTKDCASLPKHRSLMLYYNLVKSLSTGDRHTSSLWIQLIFMVLNTTSINELLIIPLLKKFSKEEQLESIKKVIGFLAQLINDPSKKRKYQSDISESPMQKKRKLTKEKEIKCEKMDLGENKDEKMNLGEIKDENDFASVKEYLLSKDKTGNYVSLLQTMMRYFLMQLKENKDDMMDVSQELMTGLISSLFSSMKLMSNTGTTRLTVSLNNEVVLTIRHIIEAVGATLSRNLYLQLIVNLAKNDNDESVKIKSLELLSNKLALIAANKTFGGVDTELLPTVTDILTMCQDIVSTRQDLSTSWDCAVSCATSIVSLGFLEQDCLKQLCVSINDSLLDNIGTNLSTMTNEKIILTNMYLHKYVIGDNGSSLHGVFQSTLTVLENCQLQKQLSNGELESALSLMHAIVCRGDSETIGWDLFHSLLSTMFELTTLDFVMRKMSKSCQEYHKNIRLKLSRMHDSKSLIETCSRLIDSGIANKNLTFVSGSISLFGCHLAELNKRKVQWNINDDDCSNIWTLVYRMLSLSETYDGQVHSCEEISIKTITNLCSLYDYDQGVLTKLTQWSQQSAENITAAIYLNRNTLIYRFVTHLAQKSTEKTKDFVNNSDTLTFASALLKHLTIDHSGAAAKKRRRVQTVTATTVTTAQIAFSATEMMTQCPQQCHELVGAICRALSAHLVAENKHNENLSVSDETIALITNVCATVTSMDSYIVAKHDYVTMAETIVTPLIVQLAINAHHDDTLLVAMTTTLCKYFTELSNNVHLGILSTLAQLKDALGATFDSNVRENVSSFLDDCKLHEDDSIAQLANDI